MAFAVFESYGAAARPGATLRASGYLFLSKGILRRVGKEHGKFCQLQFDEDTDRVGIIIWDSRPGIPTPGLRAVSPEKSGVSINVLALLRYYGFVVPTVKVLLPVTFENALIIIELKGIKKSAPAPVKKVENDFDDDIPF
jgi:hypothetical protein